jgi:pilus assembly protein CpaB
MFRNSGTRRIALAAFVALFAVWVVVAVSAMRFIREQNEEAGRTEPFVEVVYVTTLIEARAVVTADGLEVKSIPISHAHIDAAATVAEVAGQIAVQSMFAGEQVLRGKLTAIRADAGLALQIDAGQRGISVSFSEVIGAGGHIVPGDIVDVIAVFDDNVLEVRTAGYILEGVQVLAVARELQRPQVLPETGAETEDGGGFGSSPKETIAQSVTLAVSPAEAQRLALAERFGDLRLALRPLNREPGAAPEIVDIEHVFLGDPVEVATPGQSSPATADASGR